MKKIVGSDGSYRSTYYQEFEMHLWRIVATFEVLYREMMVEYALEWLARNETELMAKYPTGSLLASVTGKCRFIDFKRWYDRRAGKDVYESQLKVLAGDDKEGSFDIFEVLLTNDVDVEADVANGLLMDDIYAGIHKHLGPKLAQAFISVEMENKSVNETAEAMGTGHFNVSKWVKKAKQIMAEAVTQFPEDFGLAA